MLVRIDMKGSSSPSRLNQGAAPGEWRLGPLPPGISVLAIAGGIGLLTGTAAWLLKTMIKYMSLVLIDRFHINEVNYGLLVIPLVGIVLAIAFQKWVARRRLDHGVDRVEKMVKEGKVDIPAVFGWGPLIASTFTLGFGGSAGAEGPIATSGAAIGSYAGRRLGLSPRLMAVMIACGAGAGIAGIFKAPVGGMLFTLEVLKMELGVVPVLALVFACLISGMTSYGLTGFTLDVPLTQVQHFHPELAGWVILTGVACGVYSLYYRYVCARVRALFSRIGRPWLTGVVSGAILSVLVFLFPALYGEGYDTMAKVIDGNLGALTAYSLFEGHGLSLGFTTLLCAGIALAKPAACTASNSGGGVAGDFAPTLFAGTMAGMCFAGVMTLLGVDGIYAPNLALSAMAAVMAGVIKAPLMAIFIVVEMTGYFGMMFPVMLAAAFSYVTVLTGEYLIGKLRRQG